MTTPQNDHPPPHKKIQGRPTIQGKHGADIGIGKGIGTGINATAGKHGADFSIDTTINDAAGKHGTDLCETRGSNLKTMGPNTRGPNSKLN